MSGIEIMGIIAGGLTTTSLVPQVIKTYKSRSAEDLSLKMFSLFSLGVLLWLIYGFINKDLPIILANGFTLMLALTLLFFKFRFKGQ
jgi:MtN3 and saliva related transmembrane protein